MTVINLWGGTTMNKHLGEDGSAGDGSPASLYPLITPTAMLATPADVSRSVLEMTPYLPYCDLIYIVCVPVYALIVLNTPHRVQYGAFCLHPACNHNT